MFACGFCTHIDVFVQKIAKIVGQVQIINLLFFIIVLLWWWENFENIS